MKGIEFITDSLSAVTVDCSFTINDSAIIMANVKVESGSSANLKIKLSSDTGKSVYFIINGTVKLAEYLQDEKLYNIDGLGVGTNAIVGYIPLGGVKQ